MLASTSVERAAGCRAGVLGALVPDVVVADIQPLVGVAAALEAIPSAALLNLDILAFPLAAWLPELEASSASWTCRGGRPVACSATPRRRRHGGGHRPTAPPASTSPRTGRRLADLSARNWQEVEEHYS